MKTFTLYLFCLSTLPSIAQITEPRVESTNQLIDSLAFAKTKNDTDNIIRYAAVLTTKLQATSNEKAASYLHLALQYARFHRDRKWFADVCNRAGMLMLSYANDPTALKKLNRTAFQMQDSSLYWHRQAVNTGLAIGRKGTAGWGYRGLMATAILHYNKTVHDSIPYYYNNAMVMAALTRDQELVRYSNKLYAEYLSKQNKTTQATSDAEKISLEQFQTSFAEPTQEEQIAKLIENLAHAEIIKDTAKIIKQGIEIYYALSNAKMKNRARYYWDIVLHYATAFSDRQWLGEVYRYAGIFNCCDSARYYYSLALKKGMETSNMETIGWSYQGLINSALGYPNEHPIRDSIPFFYNKAIEIAPHLDNPKYLIFWSNIAYYNYLIQVDRKSEAGNILEKLLILKNQLGLRANVELHSRIHDYLARTNQLDTLVALKNLIIKEHDMETAATHQEQLYAKDQQYEVTKTKSALHATTTKLDLTNRVLIATIVGLIVLATLITYLFFLSRKNKRLSQRNELLLREQNHRVKNNLQMISSLLSLQSQKLNTSDAKEVLEESQSRINSVALLHRMLYEGEEVGKVEVTSYIRSLVDEIRYSTGREIKIELDLPQRLELQIEKVTSLGLIINELLTNSIKHVNPAVGLEVKLTLSSDQDALHFCYTDNGPGIAKEIWMASPSFGNQLIQIQSKQLRGKFEILVNHGFQYNLIVSS